jgi:hypothetical protein
VPLDEHVDGGACGLALVEGEQIAVGGHGSHHTLAHRQHKALSH